MSEDPPKKHRRRARRRQGKLQELLGEAKPQGLDPVDLLTKLPRDQRKLVTWLAKRQGADLTAIAAGLDQPARAVAEILSELKHRDYVRESLRDGRLTYRVVFGNRPDSKTTRLPDKIWARIDSNRVEFLRKLPLFASLAEAEVEALASQMRVRRHERDDVILWQGQVVEYIYFIRSGVASISIIQNDVEERVKYLDYAQEGDVLGEYSLFADRDQTATATVTALSAVELLYMPHDEFRQVLRRFTEAAFGIAQMLVRRLMNKMSQGDVTERHIVLVFGNVSQRLIVGSLLAGSLARDRRTAFAMFPDSHELQSAYGLPDRDGTESGPRFHPTPLGHDVAILDLQPTLPLSVRITLAMQQLVNDYATCVIGLPMQTSSALTYALEQAQQVIMLSDSSERAWADMQALLRKIRSQLPPERSAVFTMQIRTGEADTDFRPPARPDFDVACTEPQSALLNCQDVSGLPEPLVTAIDTLVARLGRTNQICIYIPTTTDVDQPIDTGPYVEETLAFLGGLFGGATSSKAQGVWNSEDAGLVGETVYIVRSFATVSGVKAHLPAIMSYVEAMKAKLKQEAMAVEVNQKLMLL